MVPRLPVLSARDVLKALSKVGFLPVGQAGSHLRLKNVKGRIVMVPNHPEIAVGTLQSIVRQSGLRRDEFLRLL